MTIVSTPGQEKVCANHEWMAFMGWYDRARRQYLKSCHNPMCDVHGTSECRQRFHRKAAVFRPDWGFFSLIIHLNYRPSSRRLSRLRKLIRVRIKSWDRDAIIGTVLHPLDGDWHLNVGVQSFWVFTPAMTDAWGDYVQNRVLGYWENGRYKKPRGRVRQGDLDATLTQLESEVIQFCASPSSNRRPPRLVRGDFHNQPHAWLWYCMRCREGWAEDEKLPKGEGYQLTSGLVKRRGSKGGAGAGDLSEEAVVPLDPVIAELVDLTMNKLLQQGEEQAAPPVSRLAAQPDSV